MRVSEPCARRAALVLVLPATQQTSARLTVGTPDANGQGARSVGSLRLGVRPGKLSTPEDEAELGITTSITDVRKASDLTDYTGGLEMRFSLRITDKSNSTGSGGPGPGTVVDIDYSFTVGCSATPDDAGSTCALSTTADVLAPGTAVEGRRAIWQLEDVAALDAGADGDAATPADNAVFARQGIFVP